MGEPYSIRETTDADRVGCWIIVGPCFSSVEFYRMELAHSVCAWLNGAFARGVTQGRKEREMQANSEENDWDAFRRKMMRQKPYWLKGNDHRA